MTCLNRCLPPLVQEERDEGLDTSLLPSFPVQGVPFFESSEILTYFLYRYFIQLFYFEHHIFMRSGKNVQRATRATGNISSDSVVPDRQEDVGSSTQPTTSTAQPSSSNVEPRPEAAIVEPEQTPRSSPIPQSTVYQNVLVDCNALVEEYRKGEMSKPTVYSKIRAKLASSLEEDTDRINAAFGSFIATVKSHDSETAMAARRGTRAGERRGAQSPFTNVSEPPSDEEPITKKSKVDESAFAWAASETETGIKLSNNLVQTLKLLGVYTMDPKTTIRSLTNSPSCPEFPESEWKNIIGGKAVNFDAVLSGQLSTTNDELKVENFGDLELSFGMVEPTKVVKNGGEWSIAWNRTVIDCKNSPDTENILSPCLQSHIPTSMPESYHLTKPSGSESGQSGILNCQITTNSPTLKLRMSIQSECQPWPAYTILLGWAGLAT